MENRRKVESFGVIEKKLETFIRKFYMNELMKGCIYFLVIGLLYLLGVLLVEHVFWLNPLGRTILFYLFLTIEGLLIYTFILIPLLKMFKISGGIDQKKASRLIGEHFPEVGDRLLNVVELRNQDVESELLVASIEQKARELSPIPFSTAIDFRRNLPLLRYTAIPLFICAVFILSGEPEIITESYGRVVNYSESYVPPAPFVFHIESSPLRVEEDTDFVLRVRTEGQIIPADMKVHYEGVDYLMKEINPGNFEYRFEGLKEPLNFYLSANEIQSRSYTLEVVPVPKIKRFQMSFEFPPHTGLSNETIEGTGNAVVPEGTVISWEIEAVATDRVAMSVSDSTELFKPSEDLFAFEKAVLASFRYTVSTSNREVQNFEELSYQIESVADELPQLELQHEMDSVGGEAHYFKGKVSDDYGISQVKQVWYPTYDPENQEERLLYKGNGNLIEFLSSFPDSLPVVEGQRYTFYFEVQDNDAINGYKSVRSPVYHYRKATAEEVKEAQLEEQKIHLEHLGQTLQERQESHELIEDLRRAPAEKGELNFNDRQKLESFLERQKEQQEMMRSFTKDLEKRLEEDLEAERDPLAAELKKRLEERESSLQQNEKLLEELRKYAEKISTEGLGQKLEDLARKSKAQERSLEQLLELTKKYYVQEKVAHLAQELEVLGKDQKQLSENPGKQALHSQDSLGRKTEEVLQNLDELREENKELRQPVKMDVKPEMEDKIREAQKEALEHLKKTEPGKAREKQKKAAELLQKMGKSLKENMQAGSRQQMQENLETLRQVMDNLITFSFEQEDLLDQFKKSGNSELSFAARIQQQGVLKEHFEHIDDSLYALALRNAMISGPVTSKLTDIEYNLNKATERLAQNQIHQGLANQQYVITGANELALLLNQIMDKMQEMINPSSGAGSGPGMQLPDIIQKQKELREDVRKELSGKEPGSKGKGSQGSEAEQEGLFELYKRQQMLRRALEEALGENGNAQQKEVEEEMKQVEERMLQEGVNEQTFQRMENLEQKLLELEKAQNIQGTKRERESRTNQKEFENRRSNLERKLEEYFNTTEILKRQSLPLRQLYKEKVRAYFESGSH